MEKILQRGYLRPTRVLESDCICVGKKGIAMGKNIAAITEKRNISSGKLREERISGRTA